MHWQGVELPGHRVHHCRSVWVTDSELHPDPAPGSLEHDGTRIHGLYLVRCQRDRPTACRRGLLNRRRPFLREDDGAPVRPDPRRSGRCGLGALVIVRGRRWTRRRWWWRTGFANWWRPIAPRGSCRPIASRPALMLSSHERCRLHRRCQPRSLRGGDHRGCFRHAGLVTGRSGWSYVPDQGKHAWR